MTRNTIEEPVSHDQRGTSIPPTVTNVPLQSEERFRLLVDSVKDYAIYILDRDGRVASWNTGAERLLGYSADEVIGKHFTIFYSLDDIESDRPGVELRTAAAQGRYQEESYRVRKDGSRFLAEVVLTAIPTPEGEISGFAKVIRDVTEKRAVEAELQNSEERNRLILNGINDYAIFMLDPQGRIASWNAGAKKINGYESHEVIGQHFSMFYPAEAVNSGHPQKELEIATSTGRYEEEGWRIRKDGSMFWAAVVIAAMRDESGQLRGFSKVTRDITERRKANENLRESEEKFRLLIEGVKDYGIFMLDPQGRVASWNAGAERINGYTADEIIGRHFSRFYTIESINAGQPSKELEIAGTRGRFEEEGWRTHKNGSKFWAHVIITALRDRSGHLIGYSKITRDVSDRRLKDLAQEFLNRASRLLVESLDYETTLAEVAQVAVETMASWAVFHLKLPNGKIKQLKASHVNARLNKWLNPPNTFPIKMESRFGPATVMRTGEPVHFRQITHQTVLENATDIQHVEVLRSLGLDSYMCVPLIARGEVFGSISLGAGPENNRQFSEADLDVVKELARRVALAVDNALLFANAEAASQAKDDFLATLSHELRTPLNVISGWVQTLKSKKLDPEIFEEALDALDRNSQVQARLINDLLDVSRIVAGKLTLELLPMDLNTNVRSAVESFQIEAKHRGIRLRVETPPTATPVKGDAQRLQQIVSNLVSNALKFTPAGGQISVCVEKTADNAARFHVKDSGMGIEPSFLPHVFESFKQEDSSTTRTNGGLGLGLSIVHSLAVLHDGSVEAHSSGKGTGATFTVSLPLLTGVHAKNLSKPKQDSKLASSNESPLTGIHVLVVDDSADVLHLLRHWLVGSGAKVTTATNTKDAFEKLKTLHPDVLLSDIGMPNEDGLDFIKRVRKLNSAQGGRIAAAALTAYARHEEGLRALRSGFNMHLAKPVARETLVHALLELTGKPGERQPETGMSLLQSR